MFPSAFATRPPLDQESSDLYYACYMAVQMLSEDIKQSLLENTIKDSFQDRINLTQGKLTSASLSGRFSRRKIRQACRPSRKIADEFNLQMTGSYAPKKPSKVKKSGLGGENLPLPVKFEKVLVK